MERSGRGSDGGCERIVRAVEQGVVDDDVRHKTSFRRGETDINSLAVRTSESGICQPKRKELTDTLTELLSMQPESSNTTSQQTSQPL